MTQKETDEVTDQNLDVSHKSPSGDVPEAAPPSQAGNPEAGLQPIDQNPEPPIPSQEGRDTIKR